MSFDASSYSSLGRRRLPSYSLSSSRSSFSSDYGSSSNHGFSPGLSSLGSTTSLSTCGLSGSVFSSRPPSSSAYSSRSSREGSFLSASMMKRDTIINSLVRTSHDLTRHDFLPADAASRSSHISHRSYRSIDRSSRSKTTDLTLSSLTARSSSDFSCFSSFATTSTYGTTYRSTYRPILIQRPTFDNYTPRPRDERQREMHSKSIRRDRPLVKFREKEDDTDPEKVRQLLDSWSPETIEELDDEDYETKKRDSVRSNDSGIGSFRSSFGKRSRRKSGEFLSYDLSPTIDERDSGTEDNEDLSSDKRYVRSRRVDHISSVDEGVHMEAEYESRSPRDIVSPLGFQDSNGRPLSRNDVPNTFAKQECVQSVAADERPANLSASIQRKEEHSSNPETKISIVDRFSRTSNRVRRRSDFDGSETLENTSDAVLTCNNRNATNRRRDMKSLSSTTEEEGTKIREMGNIQTNKDVEVLVSESEKVDKITEPNVEKTLKIESFDTCVQDKKSKGKTEISTSTSSMTKSTEKSRIFPYDHKFTADNKAESMKPRDVSAKLTSRETDETTIKKKKFKKDSDEEKKTQILSIALPSQSETSLSEASLRERDSLRMSSGKVAAELLRKKTTADSNEVESLVKMPSESHSKTAIGKLGKTAVESPKKTEVQKLGSISTEPSSKTIESPSKSTIKSPGQNTAESPNKVSVWPFSKTKTESLSKTKIQLPTESATTESAIKKATESSDKTSTESSEELKIRTLRTEISGKMPVESSNKIPSTKPDKITGESSNKKQPESPAKSVVETSNCISVGHSNKTKTESQTKPSKTEAPSENTVKTFSKPPVGLPHKVAVESLSKAKDESFTRSETHSTSKSKMESLSKTAATDSRNKMKEPLSKTATDSISKMEVESLNKTATDSYCKTKVKTLDKLETDSPSKTKVETLNKTAIDSPSKTKVETLNKTAIDSPSKTKVESLSKTQTTSPSKTETKLLNKIETESDSKTKAKTFDKTAIDSPSKTKIESLSKTAVDSPSKTEMESLSKTATESHNKTKVKSFDKTAIDSPSKTKIESLSKTAADSPSKTEIESLSKTATESHSKTKVKTLDKTAIDLPSKTKVESLGKSAADSPSKTEAESLSQAVTESHSKTKVKTSDKTAIDLPSKTKVESLSKRATDPPSKTETESLNKTATESPSKTKIKTLDKTATDSPSKIKVEPSSKMTTDSHNKTKVESFNKSTIDSPIKAKDEPFSKRTAELSGKKTDLPHKLATSDETKDSAFQTDVKPALLVQTGKVDAHGIVSDTKSNNEQENLKAGHKLTKDSGETTGAIPKTKRENFIKTDTLDKNKRSTVDSDYIVPTKKDEKQFKCSESSVSQTHECNEVRSKNSSSKTDKSVSFSVSEISHQKDIKTGTAAKSEAVAAKSKLLDNKADNIAFEKDSKLSISSERTAKEFSDLQKLNSKTTDITTPSHSQNTDKCVPSLPDAKQPLIRKEKEKNDLRDTERKDKFNIDRPERKAAAEKNVLSSDQQVLKEGERNKELLLESVNKKTSRDKEIASFEKDVSLLKTGEGVHKDVKKSPETTDTETQKQLAAAFTVSSESNEDSKTQDRFPVSSKVTDITTQGKVLSVSEKSLSNDVTSERSVNQLKNDIDSTSDTKDVKFSKTYSSERKKSGIEEAPINDDSTKENVDPVENKIATPQNIPTSESKICVVEKKFEEELSEKSTKESKYQRDDNSEACDSKPVIVETSDVRPQTERKRVAFAIQKSSSEDFKHDNSNSAGQASENFKLQKSSSAGTKAPKRTKPPLPTKALIPPHVPALQNETSKADDQCLEKNVRFQKYSSEANMDFKGDHSNQRSYDLKKSSTAGKINFKDDSSESSKLYNLKKSNTTECNRLVRKPPIRGNRLLGKPSQLTEQKVQAKECIISVRTCENLGEIAHVISVGNKSSEIGEQVLKPKDAEENIPKENKENLSAKGSTIEDTDRSSQASEVSEVAPENEVKLETVKVGIDADANQQIISDRPGKQGGEDSPVSPIETARDIEQLSKDTGDAVSKTDEPPIPPPRVARPYLPKNRLVPSKSDSNVPMRQLMTSSSAPNIAIEKVREKIAKKTGLSEYPSKIPAEKVPPKSVQDIKEKDLLSSVDDSSKTHQLSDKNRLISQGKEPQEKINLKLGSEISKEITEKSGIKSESENASESVVPSHEFKELQKDSSSTEHHTNAEISGPEKVESEKETAPRKEDSHADNKEHHAQDGRNLSREKEISKESLAKEVPSTRDKEQVDSTANTTESVEAKKLKTDSTQKTELHTIHSEKLVTAKILAKCIESQQIVTESSLVTTKSEPAAVIPILKGRSEDDTTSEIISNALPTPKKDTEDTAAVDSKTAEPKVKKAKKPKAEGEEKVKKKKKKKEKLEVTEETSDAKKETSDAKKETSDAKIEISDAKKETVESSTKESAASGKICEETSASEDLKNSTVENIHSKENSECKTNCHKKCEKSVPHLCGVNEKLLSEVLATVKKDLSTPSSGVNNEASATTDTYSVNICNLTPPQSPAISDTEDVCDQLWNENKRSESSESFRQSRNSGTIRFKKYSVEDFHFLKVLGRGSYGKVMLSELKGNSQYFAVKCLKKDVVLEDNDVECTMIEKKVLAMGSSHPYLCTLFCTFQSQSHLFFVMEYLSGGDLMFHIQQSGRFDQERAKFYAAEIVCALKYLHKRGIVYRDAKLDNICLDSEGHIRLVDFGFCKLRIYRKECLPRNLCGTPDYMAPEIIKGHHYNQSVDWWSFGVLLYEMLIGQSPFNGTDEEELFWSVCNEEAYYPRFLTKEAKHLLVLLLEKNPEKRLGMPGCVAGDICHQPFFKHTNWEKVEKKEVDPPFKPKLKSETDVSNFDSDFTMEKALLTPIDKQILDSMDQSQFQGFSYTNPRITD